MTLKLCCALSVTWNCLKSRRISFTNRTFANISGSLTKPRNICNVIQQAQWLSTQETKDKRQKNPIKQIYFGPLAAHVRAVKLFSLSSSIVGITVQPLLYSEIVGTGNIPIIMAAYSFIGFFTVVTPLLLHFITKKYVLELRYNEETDTYIAKTLNFFCAAKEIEFKADDVYVPDVPGLFVTFHIKGKPLFVDPRQFDQPDHYKKLMGYDKPMDFKLFDSVNKTPSSPSPNPSDNSGLNK